MNGHRDLIAMRRAGYKPDFVFVNDNPCPTDWAKWGDHPTVCVDGDTPELEDYRFLIGTTVFLSGFDASRIERLTKVFEPIAKRVIAGVCTRPTSTCARCEVISITDTEGVLTWPE
jgi:hypothetical protein